MSDITVLSNQYEKLVATSDKVNNSVIVFKKKRLLNDKSNRDKFPKLAVTDKEIEEARDTLLPFLDNIKKILDEDFSQSEYIPTIILQDYKEKLLSSAYLKDDVNTLIERIKDNLGMADDNIEVLDKILSILDNERSMLFRKLRKARG